MFTCRPEYKLCCCITVLSVYTGDSRSIVSSHVDKRSWRQSHGTGAWHNSEDLNPITPLEHIWQLWDTIHVMYSACHQSSLTTGTYMNQWMFLHATAQYCWALKEILLSDEIHRCCIRGEKDSKDKFLCLCGENGSQENWNHEKIKTLNYLKILLPDMKDGQLLIIFCEDA